MYSVHIQYLHESAKEEKEEMIAISGASAFSRPQTAPIYSVDDDMAKARPRKKKKKRVGGGMIIIHSTIWRVACAFSPLSLLVAF